MEWDSIIKLGREPVATIKHSVKIMAEKENNQRQRAPSTSTSIEPQKVARHGLRKTRKAETSCRWQPRQLGMKTKKDTKASISIFLIAASLT